MTGYVNPFGSTVQPSSVAYRAMTLAANTNLVWPSQSQSATDYVARLMDVTATSGGLTLTMPDATAQSAGFDVLLTNPGANTYTVANSSGSTICTVAPGQSQYVWLKDASTAAGSWGVLQFGSLSSAVVAASLVGPGIKASGSTLYAAEPVSIISTNTAVQVSDRTTMFVWTGGVGTLTLPASGSAGADYFVSITNQGSGALTVQCSGGDTLDGASSQQFLIGESCVIHCAGGSAAAWYTVGRGRSTQFNFTLLSKSVTGGTYTLTAIEASNTVQKYTGTLTSNQTIIVPSTVQIYYISNQTSGAFSLTFKTSAVGGTTITVPQNQNAVLACDGTNVINTSTTISGISSLTLAQGSVTVPSINYSGDGSTGIYQPASSSVAVSIAGTEVTRIAAAGVGVGTQPNLYNTAGRYEVDINGSTSALLGFGIAGTAKGYLLTTSGSVELGAATGSYIDFAINAVEQARINTVGLGLGKIPAVRLDVDSGTTQQFAAFNTTNALGGYLTVSRSGAATQIIGHYSAASGGGSTIAADALFLRSSSGIGFGSGGAAVAAFLDTSGNFLVNTSAASWGAANRVTVELNGSSSALYGLKVAGAQSGYLLHNGTDFSVINATASGSFNIGTNNATKVTVTSDGRLYGAALHNNAGAMTGTTNQYIGSGTYTPTLSVLTNAPSATANKCQWTRTGNVVSVSGSVATGTMSAGATSVGVQINLSLPIASGGIASVSDINGAAGFGLTVSAGSFIKADTTNKNAALIFTPSATTASTVWFTFQYEVL